MSEFQVFRCLRFVAKDVNWFDEDAERKKFQRWTNYCSFIDENYYIVMK